MTIRPPWWRPHDGLCAGHARISAIGKRICRAGERIRRAAVRRREIPRTG
jgi:hypothetical protein